MDRKWRRLKRIAIWVFEKPICCTAFKVNLTFLLPLIIAPGTFVCNEAVDLLFRSMEMVYSLI